MPHLWMVHSSKRLHCYTAICETWNDPVLGNFFFIIIVILSCYQITFITHTQSHNSLLCLREAKQHLNPKNLEDAIDDFGEIIMATCNSNGTKVSITVAKVQMSPSS
jgi:hypothetical protein